MTRADYRVIVLAIAAAGLFAADLILLGVPSVFEGY